jgi:hypothetical protein
MVDPEPFEIRVDPTVDQGLNRLSRVGGIHVQNGVSEKTLIKCRTWVKTSGAPSTEPIENTHS